MHPMINIALIGIRKAANLIVKYYEMPNNSNIHKVNSNETITNINKAAETIIIETVHKFYPKHVIITDKFYKYRNTNQDVQWIIDSLNGVTNFIKNLPYFVISIAIRVKNRTEISVVYDPMRNELFTAIRGQGAKLNNYRLRSSNARSISGSVLAIGLPVHKKKTRYISIYIKILRKLFSKCADFRYIGSSSLNLVYVAAGRVDGYFEIGLNPLDFIAGELIVRESGALMCDFTGSHDYIINGNIIAGNPKIVKDILVNIRNEINTLS